LTLTARPIRDFTVTGTFAYQHAYLSEAAPALGGVQGERLPNVPRFTAAVNADYNLPGGSLRPTVGTTLRYVSDRRASFDDGVVNYFPQYSLPDYVAVDLRNGYVVGSVNLQLYVHNLFDTRGQLSADTSRGPAVQVATLQPRTFGISASTHF
jgi:iron complex outermembrane recepter protein